MAYARPGYVRLGWVNAGSVRPRLGEVRFAQVGVAKV